MNKLDFSGRSAIVTGGMQGIGAAIVKRLKASGAEVTVWDLDGSPKVDVSDPASIANALKGVKKVDVLVNNAGIAGKNVPTVDYPIEEWERVLRINLTSQFLCCRAVAPLMVKAKYGRIVNIASIAGKEGNPNAVAYSASKAGRHLAHQVAGQGAGEGRRAGQLRDAGGGEDRDLRPDDAAAYRLHAFQDPHGPLRRSRRDRGPGVLARLRGLLVLHRRRIRHFRRQGNLLRRRNE